MHIMWRKTQMAWWLEESNAGTQVWTGIALIDWSIWQTAREGVKVFEYEEGQVSLEGRGRGGGGGGIDLYTFAFLL